MKKIAICISIILCLIAIPITITTCAALVTSETIQLTGATEVAQNETKVELTVSLTNTSIMPEIQETTAIGCEAKIEYDNTIFSSVEVEGLNGWVSSYSTETNLVTWDTTISEITTDNLQIGKIILTLSENVQPGTTSVRLSNGLLALGEEYEQSFVQALPITITQAQTQEPSGNNTVGETGGSTQNTTENTAANQTNTANTTNTTNTTNTANTTNTTTNKTNTTKAVNNDTTTASTKLPKTGMEKIALIAVITIIVGAGCLIRYKMIKIK